MIDFITQNGGDIVQKTWEHFYISAIALILGIVVAVPLGILLSKLQRTAKIVLGITSVLQTLPSLAILAIMIPFLGVGKIPAIIALFIYTLLPILNNTYIGMNSVNSGLKSAGISMGMTKIQSIGMVELPLAIPVIMSGIRLSAVYAISWATLASYIGAGGLGDFIFNGLNLYQPEFIIGGAVLVTILALITDFILSKVEKWATPRGLKIER
ncbi:ABC transporter permease [Viridibacillus sp. FSL R5-0477]|uniref:Glycine/betaine ABC transporter permease n=2 Tax=Viridibacillus TaxID=496496 RepID=W4F3Z8_9BACL|nr:MULTISPECIES: ABC transporter permease [Viridibacillus]ETT87480.1 glycine/betaine ABC transporter permease [Viridibacillus arenosi FSL R5-213]KOO49994.1 choline ABC transporter permease [Viridibacillus arvi]OMC82543.1 choline ABC transporter permease [Viridibacillus sp. FSL H8-0123]OMC87715.1 choline ABC transporter permease [Viridibacillus sp. FSL H7-0596]OMC91259.1 choline ABC transporter permease [Viridibacillus arenosi]